MTLSCSEDGSNEPCDGAVLAGGPESLDEVLARHKKEKKDLQGKIMALKKAVPKGNGKQKKQVTEEVARLEAEIKERHAQELAAAEANNASSPDPDTAADTPETDTPSPDAEVAPKLSKAQKRREKKLEESKRRDALNKEALVDALTAPRTREKQAINRILANRNMQIYDIVPDGDCLYNALAHQLSGSSSGEKLRTLASEYIEGNKLDFLPFLTTADGDVVEDGEAFEDYCLKVRLPSRDGGVWGGEAELRAISEALKRKIEVVHADGRLTTFGENCDTSDPLVVTYHQHAYSLGEHYNSTEPLSKSEDEDSDC
ncbi:hypothetical protein QR680_016958 [Steinernema hermaphroditum]|uniref:OTU domain-containing protein n=1 Tax=Steinernema hermaphroditum TaxID=289476 RepID=A0AA39LNH4_9BILA|nr:hypothetical protein QR680_016958 [Steinernema hermaphroditum]